MKITTSNQWKHSVRVDLFTISLHRTAKFKKPKYKIISWTADCFDKIFEYKFDFIQITLFGFTIYIDW